MVTELKSQCGSPLRDKEMTDRKSLAEACYRMGTHGGYVLAFSTSIAAQNPELSWPEFRAILLDNGHGFCGHAEIVVRRAFERGR